MVCSHIRKVEVASYIYFREVYLGSLMISAKNKFVPCQQGDSESVASAAQDYAQACDVSVTWRDFQGALETQFVAPCCLPFGSHMT